MSLLQEATMSSKQHHDSSNFLGQQNVVSDVVMQTPDKSNSTELSKWTQYSELPLLSSRGWNLQMLDTFEKKIFPKQKKNDR